MYHASRSKGVKERENIKVKVKVKVKVKGAIEEIHKGIKAKSLRAKSWKNVKLF
jgi:hypothetical protein